MILRTENPATVQPNQTSNATALLRRAAALAQAHRHGDAVTAYQSAIRLIPDLFEAHANMAVSLASCGDLERAISAARRALVLKPNSAEVHSNLGRLTLREGDAEAAKTSFRRAISISPHHGDGLLGLGNALASQSLSTDAIAVFRAAIVLDPRMVPAFSNLALLFAGGADKDQAAFCAKSAVRLRPDFAETHHILARALENTDDLEWALLSGRRCVVLKPDHAEGWSNLASTTMFFGQLPSARAAIRHALALSPEEPRYYRALSVLRSWQAPDDVLSAMESLLRRIGPVSPRDLAELRFALAKVHEDLGHTKESFDHLRHANALIRKTLNYSEDTILGWFDTLARITTKGYLDARGKGGFPSDKPIFIVGMPRSGTSLVEQIVASHSLVFGAGESTLFSQLLDQILRRKGPPWDLALQDVSPTDLVELGRDYVARISSLAPNARHITDKMPGNFRYVGLIRLALPNAKIIHCRRDPIDNCLSCFGKLFGEGNEFTYDLRELGRYYRSYRRLMAHWEDVLPAEAMLTVDYETLVADFESEVKKILAFCDLAWEEGCLNFHQTRRVVRTASATQVRRPLYSSAIGKARPDGDQLEPLVAELGGY